MEIERKWIIKELPKDYTLSSPILYERHFIFNQDDIEIRIQRKGNRYELERKVKQSQLSRDTMKVEITENEYNRLKELSVSSISRESYMIAKYPEISIKRYLDRCDGLIRVEIEFDSEDQAINFKPYDWFGEEITNSVLGRDSELIKLSELEFKQELIKYLM